MTYRDKLISMLDRWEKERGTTLPCPGGRDARTIVGWIRMAISEGDNLKLELAQHNLGKLGCRLAKAEQELRGVTRDRDRWRNRAHEAEALVRSLGVQAPRTDTQFNHVNPAGNRS
jgi:hypothetical protein